MTITSRNNSIRKNFLFKMLDLSVVFFFVVVAVLGFFFFFGGGGGGGRPRGCATLSTLPFLPLGYTYD